MTRIASGGIPAEAREKMLQKAKLKKPALYLYGAGGDIENWSYVGTEWINLGGTEEQKRPFISPGNTK